MDTGCNATYKEVYTTPLGYLCLVVVPLDTASVYVESLCIAVTVEIHCSIRLLLS